MATNAGEVNWLVGALNDYIANRAENGYWNLSQVIAQHYAQRGNRNQTPEEQSEVQAATRGARYAQEGRINAIRSSRGQEAFDPMSAPPAPSASADPSFVSQPEQFHPSLSAGTPPPPYMTGGIINGQQYYGMSYVQGATNPNPNIYEESPAHPGYYFMKGHGPVESTISQANPIAFGGDANQVSGQMEGLKSYLTTRYTGAAARAGTLSGTAESKAAVGADVAAGLPGAQLALQGQLDTSQQGATGRIDTRMPTPTAMPSTPQDTRALEDRTGEPEAAKPMQAGLVSGTAPTQAVDTEQGKRLKSIKLKTGAANGR